MVQYIVAFFDYFDLTNLTSIMQQALQASYFCSVSIFVGIYDIGYLIVLHVWGGGGQIWIHVEEFACSVTLFVRVRL